MLWCSSLIPRRKYIFYAHEDLMTSCNSNMEHGNINARQFSSFLIPISASFQLYKVATSVYIWNLYNEPVTLALYSILMKIKELTLSHGRMTMKFASSRSFSRDVCFSWIFVYHKHHIVALKTQSPMTLLGCIMLTAVMKVREGWSFNYSAQESCWYSVDREIFLERGRRLLGVCSDEYLRLKRN